MNIVPFGLLNAQKVTVDSVNPETAVSGEFAMLLAQTTAPQAVTAFGFNAGNTASNEGSSSANPLLGFVDPAAAEFFSGVSPEGAGLNRLAAAPAPAVTGSGPQLADDVLLNAAGAVPAATTTNTDKVSPAQSFTAAPIYKDPQVAASAVNSQPVATQSAEAPTAWATAKPATVQTGDTAQLAEQSTQTNLQLTGTSRPATQTVIAADAGKAQAQSVLQQGDAQARPAIAQGRVPVEQASQPSVTSNTKPAAMPTGTTTGLMTQPGALETALKQATPESNSFGSANAGESTARIPASSASNTATSGVAVETGANTQKDTSSSSGNGQGSQGQASAQSHAAASVSKSMMADTGAELLPDDFVQEMELAEADAGQDVQMTEAQRNAVRAEAAQSVAARGQSATQAAILSQVNQRILQKFDGKSSRFEIRLDPAELGKVDVRIEVDRDGRVQAVLAAKDAVAAEALTRGLRSLENALTQAGFDLGEKGVQVNVDDNSSKKSFTHSGDSGEQGELQQAASDIEQQPAEARTVTPQIQAWPRQRLDLTA